MRVKMLIIAVMCALFCGCASGRYHAAEASPPPSLSTEDIHFLQDKSMTVIVVDSDEPVYPIPFSGEGHMVQTNFSPVADLLIGIATTPLGMDPATQRFEEKLRQYEITAAKLDESDRTYAAVQDALTSVPWLAHASWQRWKPSDGKRSLDLEKLTTTPVAIVIRPTLALRYNLDNVVLNCVVSIYRVPPSGSGGMDYYTGTTLAASYPIGPDGTADTSSVPQKILQGGDLDRRMAEVFANDAAELNGVFTQWLAPLQSDLKFYFDGRP